MLQMKDKTGRTAMDLIPRINAHDTADVVNLKESTEEDGIPGVYFNKRLYLSSIKSS